MYKKLRIACTIISALFLAAIMPAGSIWDWKGFLFCGLGAGLFFLFMLIFKQCQQDKEEKRATESFDENITEKNETENLQQETNTTETENKDES